jgi:hypothetical protein
MNMAFCSSQFKVQDIVSALQLLYTVLPNLVEAFAGCSCLYVVLFIDA